MNRGKRFFLFLKNNRGILLICFGGLMYFCWLRYLLFVWGPKQVAKKKAKIQSEQKMEKLGVFAQLGVRYNGEDGDTKWKPGIGFYIQGRAGYDITDRLPGWVSLTYFNQGDGEADGSKLSDSLVNWLEIEVGGSYKITNELWVSVPLQYTLTGTNTLADLGIGVVIGYYLGK